MRQYICDKWQFSEKFDESMLGAGYKGEAEDVRIPHSVVETPYNCFDESIYQMVSGYRRIINLDKNYEGKVILLTFDAVGHDAVVYLNGEQIGSHHTGYTAFTIDLSDKIRFGEDNILAVKVDSRESLNTPPFGFVIDYMTYGGIYRDVYIDIKESAYISDIYVHPEVKIDNGHVTAKVVSDIEVCQKDIELLDGSVTISQILKDKKTGEERKLGEIALNLGKTIRFDAGDVQLWSPDEPYMYEVITVLTVEGKECDRTVTSTAFRTIEFKNDGFYLNGRKFLIRGLNRHQCYPYVGYAMPKSMQVMDAKVLKYELGLNAVRTSHYPNSHYFLDACDEIGLLVFTEIPGWQHIGDEAWKAQAVKNVEEMVCQYRNHPSIILWGVRINESQDDDAFYEKTNAVAHKLDPYRQTGGVRYIKKSHLLEDVYTFNDFSHDGTTPGCQHKKDVTPDVNKGYFISEYGGHMYPTKSFDDEEHRLEHALRHARVIDAVAGEEGIAGSFGWCMADYNTHRDFGSGDRICYHGVLDMYRNPKQASWVYSCGQDEEPVLEVSSNMDIGEHPAGNNGKIYIYSNAESVKMYKNGKLMKEYTHNDSEFKNITFGPIRVTDFVGNAVHESGLYSPKQADLVKYGLNANNVYGMNHLPLKAKWAFLKAVAIYHMSFGDMADAYGKFIGDWGGEATEYKFEAIKNGKVVKTLIKTTMSSVHMEAEADHTSLKEDHTYDVAVIRIRALDQNNNLQAYCQEPVEIVTEGPIELIGPALTVLRGGMGGTYVRTMGSDCEIEVIPEGMNRLVIRAK
ncbi:MAG: glycoside hydrolase family 2 protein [Lachnospiraceae bacterium]|nr:glycoside hydrolase family 2 protein [Lachnospiraceae bacterium]